jgi:hypothetical protein
MAKASKTKTRTRSPLKKTQSKALPRTWDTVRKLAVALPGVEESTSYGTPAFKVRGKLFVRLHQSGDALVVSMDENDRALRMKADPETYFITDHYLAYPWILVRLSLVQEDDLRELLEDAWRRVAPQNLIDSYAP